MLFFTLLFCTATWHLGDATSCTAATGNTCEKTSFVTGTCNNGMCDCIAGYEPTLFGCIAKVKPFVQITASDGRNPEATSKGSGEVFAGGKISLACLPIRNGMTYVWSKDNVDVSSMDTTNTLILSSVNSSHSGQYRCKYRMDVSNYLSDLSEPVTVKVVPVSGTFGNQPVITGMYKRATLNAVLPLECTNTPSGIGLTYEWYLDGTITNVRTSTYSLTITNQTVSKNITCKIGQSPPVVNAVLALPESVPVNTPNTLTEDISGVTILQALGDTTITRAVGKEILLECAINDTDLAAVVTYKWANSSTDISQTSLYNKTGITTADSGVYLCSGNVGTRAAKQSNPLTVQVVPPKEIVGNVGLEVVPPGATPILGGYMSIKCFPEVRNLSKIRFYWVREDGRMIAAQRDNQIQINGFAPKDAGKYQCQVSPDGVSAVSQYLAIQTPVAIDTIAPNTPTADKPPTDSFGVGNSYTLTCASGYDSPGLSYRWTEGTQVIAGATSRTYKITAKPGVSLYSCQIVFNGTASKSSPSLTVAAKNLIGVAINLAGSPVSGTTIKPLTATKVTLECKATTAVSSSASPTYAWLKADQKLQNQAAASYEFTSGAASDGEIKCSATVGNETLNSEKVTVTAVATLEVPTVESNNLITLSGTPIYTEGGTYTLLCKTASHTDSVSYSWMKNGTVIDGASGRSYTISGAKRGKDGDSGVYSCKATQGASTVTSSPGITITIEEPGRPCKFATECQGDQYGPTCTSSRCECASGYTAKGNTCSKSGVAHLTSSAALLLISAALARWLYQELL